MRIDTEGIDVTLAGEDILQAVDATVEPGHLVGLVGPNGAGKTTLLRTITAVLDPERGNVFVGDEDIHAMSSRAASRRLATVPQKTNLNFEFTVREVVEMGRHPHRSRLGSGNDDEAAVVDAAMARARVEDLADRKVTTLSGGERQRVLIARAIAQDAPVLVLDEPTASLDVHHQVRTLSLVRDIVDEGRTGIAAIHDLDLAARFCDSLLLVADGTVMAAGSPADVLTPDRIRRAFGADAVVTIDPVTGTPNVTVHEQEHTTALDCHVHVVGGTTHAARFLPALADAATTLTVGPVLAGSQDESVARGLGLDVMPVDAYAGLDEAVKTERHDDVADDASLVVVPHGLDSTLAETLARKTDARLVEPGPEATVEELVAALSEVLDRQPAIEELRAD